MNAPARSDRPAWIEVDLSAIANNIAAVKTWVGPHTDVLAVVKANAYGHGLLPAARAALRGGAKILGVALLEEGQALRQEGITAPILVMGNLLPEQAPALIESDLDAMVSNRPVVEALSKAAQVQKKSGHLHLKVDTGMGRVGLFPEDAPDLAKTISDLSGIELTGLATHLAWEQATDFPKAEAQIARFQTCLTALQNAGIQPRLCHGANSVMTIHLPQSHFNLVRVGLLTYGIPPTGGASHLSLTPALTLKARIAQLRTLPAGQPLSYGGTFTLKRNSQIAILPIGYADGYNRRLSNRSTVLVQNHRCPVVGAVCMDQILVDVTEVPRVKLGDEATLLGKTDTDEISVWELVRTQQGIPHEITTQLGSRLPRIYC